MSMSSLVSPTTVSALCKQRVRPVPVLGVQERLAGDEETVSKRASLRLDALGRMRLPS